MEGVRRRVTFARTAAAKAGSWSWAGVSAGSPGPSAVLVHRAAGRGGGLRVVAVREHNVIGGDAVALGLGDELEHVLVLRLARHALHVGDVARRHHDLAHQRLAPYQL